MEYLTAGIAIASKVIDKYFNNNNRKPNSEEDLLAVGLAYGYFYNFLEPLSTVLRANGELKLVDKENEPNPHIFSQSNLRIQIIIPKRLDGNAFDACNAEFGKAEFKRNYYSNENKRMYGLNYNVSNKGSTINIIDLARPIMAAKHFYENILKYQTGMFDEKWLKIQQAEKIAFIETIKKSQERGYGTLLNQISFVEIG
ncbi:MAG: hypothetical protein DWQ44_09765 [Bacteroidetes bacterium]|nr:MAG: hypothetical protein DWQ33_10040 [Bacteroidota bacterium]REK06570.1 MAG: hypothetical protein DWQ39_03555 [Bacteroidota bacterium]REK33336.1 MAG: hypothetical protein DWQ44_09765 [Bacteroidota bacterium]REK49736.1 MAG: hypothetical protein DWQ48_06320 [Bacteroidota bacterium]